jgi:hypothetical protein
MKVASEFNRPSDLSTSVLFLVFNRPEQTSIVFESIRKARPPKLYIACDGPRDDKEGDNEKVLNVREIVSKVDWPCNVFTLFREKNMGCKDSVSNAITWFFSNEEKGIILEDDCLPSLSFFWYCEFMLNRFLNDEQVFLISGDGRVSSKTKIESDIAYCKYPLIWGWASWSRVWKKYDVQIKNWPSIKNKIIEKHNKTYNKLFWENTFQLLYENKINTWDYQLAFLMQEYSAICIIPKYNLISNIGFGEDATHTFDKNSINANVLSNEIELPINLNFNKSDNNKINNYFDENEFYYPTRFFRFKKKLISIFCN